ncbi:MAG TPA: histidinol-phosphatase [Caulobacteraceae bacterium]|nr:histidinol-phosphatase [Caulobacteraceae bacterium]
MPVDLLAPLESFLVELNRVSAATILPFFRAEHGLEDKGAEGVFDPVTAADRGGEAAIRRLIAERHPSHGVIGEEYGEDRPEAEFVWVLDPIDGTRAFIAGLPVWTTLIGLRFQGRPVLGSIGQPYLGEVFIGGPGGSRLMARGSEEPLRTRAGVRLKDAIIATTDPRDCFKTDQRPAWNRLRAAARLARLGCDAYAYAMVAAGGIDVVLEPNLKSWDIEAAIPVVEGAGGLVRDWAGAPIGPGAGEVVIAGDEALLDETLAVLSEA